MTTTELKCWAIVFGSGAPVPWRHQEVPADSSSGGSKTEKLRHREADRIWHACDHHMQGDNEEYHRVKKYPLNFFCLRFIYSFCFCSFLFFFVLLFFVVGDEGKGSKEEIFIKIFIESAAIAGLLM